ncbi:excalibur calcium-binding domain-containing protein [Actinomycetospora termitidis]|uniref:Excalibur calcium-binding domain-containing protein n=1 Tax=Actinomycetospora termitidis TaxID=3053470 RepID=A0ABT7MG27_9PSEU|nr:excalibur calcium-binding domain-containing protein [Actinomycetospora sp. Odt1-22]MDL5159621.1 excalibur calcium-binding domain-containing protein [Actinomycetospora sp. Odt1-22]
MDERRSPAHAVTRRCAACNDKDAAVEVWARDQRDLGDLLLAVVRERVAAFFCALVVVGGLLVGGGVASAQDSSDPKCQAVATAEKAKKTADDAYADAKTKLTNASSAVTEAEAAANAAPNDTALQTALAAARAAHNKAMTAEAAADSTRKGAAMNLAQALDAAAKAGLTCTKKTTTTTTTTTPPKKPGNDQADGGQTGGGSQTGGGGGPTKPGAPGPDLNCRDFVSRPAAQAVLDTDQSDPHHLDADHDGYACEDYFGDPSKDPQVSQDKTVNHTEDDGSEADTSGNQVTVVPEGSADTGSAL